MAISLYDKLMDLEGVTHGTETYDQFSKVAEKIMSSWRFSEQSKNKI